MTANQANAKSFNPNELNLVRVATYQRIIQASDERVWENVLDWEHLPWLHESSFDLCDLDAAGTWGWRTWSNTDRTDHIELTVAENSSYVARSYKASQQISEIWTRVMPRGEQTRVEVEFWLPDIEDEHKAAIGDMMLSLYTTLWDEDEAMMVERQRRLDERRSRNSETALGNVKELEQRLAQAEQVCFQLRGREFQLRLYAGEIIAHSAICPHLLGPLTDCNIDEGSITCPWHGYRFDVESGSCQSPATATCRLPAPPSLIREGDQLIARYQD